MNRHGGEAVYWAMCEMRDAGLITDAEEFSFITEYTFCSRDKESAVFMDLLAARARREGRLQ